MAENKNPAPYEPPKKFNMEDSDAATISNSENVAPSETRKIAQQRIEVQKDNPLKSKKLWAIVAASLLGLTAIGGGSYTIAKVVSQPSTEPTSVTVEKGEKEAQKLTKDANKTTPQGTEVEPGQTAKTVGGLDPETNLPYIQSVTIDKVKEVSLKNVAGKDYSEVFGDLGGRAFYVTVTLEADPKPSESTPIPFGVLIMNDSTPVDTAMLGAVPLDHPDCTYGPATWGEIEGNKATKCSIVFTRNNEPIKEILLSEENSDSDAQYNNPIKLKFKTEEISQ